MRRRWWITALLLLGVGGSNPTYTTTIRVRLADPVERRVWGIGVKPEQFWFSFKTEYRINGLPVSAYRFWRTPLRGRELQVKAMRREGFWFATAVNVKRSTP